MISVLIPTANRPFFLGQAIESVRKQSRLDLIGEVIVSNNGSADVVDVVSKFSDLPITYVTQSIALTPGAHFEWLVNEAKYDWVAMLSDDDLWGRYHLEESERLLRKHCGAIAVCSQTVTVRNACCQVLNGYAQLTHTFKKENHLEYDDCYVFKPGEILIDSLIRTPLNFWSLVARKSSVSKHIQVMSEDNPGIDSDRFFFWRLNSEGSIIAAREVGHFMRCHESMGGDLMSRQNEMKYDEKTKAYSYLIVKEAEAMGISVKENWRLFWESLNANDEEAILRNSYNDCVLIACRILNSGPFGKFRYLSVRALIIRTLKAWLPPILTNALIKLRNRVR